MHRGEIGELLDPSALAFVPSVSLTADNALDGCFFCMPWNDPQSIGGASLKQTPNDDRKVQFAIPKMQQ